MRARLTWLMGVLFLAACGGSSPGGGGTQGPEAPRWTLAFGSVPVGSFVEKPLLLRNAGGEPMEIVPPAVEAPYTVEPSTSFTLAPGEERNLLFRFAPTTVGPMQRELPFRFGGREGTLVLDGTAVTPAVTCASGELAFGEALPRTTSTRPITCTNESDREVTLSIGQPEGAGARFFLLRGPGGVSSLRIAAGGQVELEGTFLANELGEHEAVMPVFEGEIRFELRLRGTVVPTLLAVLPEESLSLGVDVGVTRVGVPVRETITLHNLADVPVGIDGLRFADAAFTVSPGGFLELGPGETTDITVTFRPTALGSHTATMAITTDLEGQPEQELHFRGLGAEPGLACTAEPVSLGRIPVGHARTRSFTCTVASRVASEGKLVIGSVASGRPDFTAAIREPKAEGWAGGESFAVDVTWTPTAAGIALGSVTLEAPEPRTGAVSVELFGEALELPGCAVSVGPGDTLEFGVVQPGIRATLDLVVRNDGTGECWVGDVAAEGAGAEAFWLRGWDGEEALLPAGEELLVSVDFVPLDFEEFAGSLAVHTADPARRKISIPLHGTGREPCLFFSSNPLAFDGADVACSHERMLGVTNVCTGPISVAAATVHASGPLESGAVSLPLEIPASSTAEIPVAFHPDGTDPIFGRIELESDDGTYVAALYARGAIDPTTIDRFTADESTTSLTLSETPIDADGDGDVDGSGDVAVRMNWVLVPQYTGGGAQRWSVSGTTVTFAAGYLPEPGDEIEVTYRTSCGTP